MVGPPDQRNPMHRSLIAAIALVTLIVPFANAQDDHLECFRIKDPINLKGIVDLESSQLGLDAGCRIQKAKYTTASRRRRPSSQSRMSETLWDLE
jgi:hypothetical protein